MEDDGRKGCNNVKCKDGTRKVRQSPLVGPQKPRFLFPICSMAGGWP